jgi:hypothetical protein
MKISTVLQCRANADWFTIQIIFVYPAVSQHEAKRPVSGECGLAAVPEYELGAEDNQSSEMQLTVGTLYVH